MEMRCGVVAGVVWWRVGKGGMYICISGWVGGGCGEVFVSVHV